MTTTQNTITYCANPSGGAVADAMRAGRIAAITTPKQGNVLPAGAFYCADNGKFGAGWPGTDAWWAWLTRTVARYGSDRCLFATAPDVVCDAAGTLAESLPWLARIRALGVPAAFVAQDGCEHGDLVPWGQFDVLFLGGSTEWKLGPAAAALAAEAKRRGIKVHMGRVNSRRRLRYAASIGADTADGTYLAFGPDTNLPRVLGWVDEIAGQDALFAAVAA